MGSATFFHFATTDGWDLLWALQKLENVMLSRTNGLVTASIIDFGFAEELSKGSKCAPKGSLDYAAPEVVRYEPNTGTAVDIWAAGVMLYSMLATKFPFFGRTMGDLRHAIMRAAPSYDGPHWESKSDEARDIVQSMLTADADERPSAKELLSHPWLAGHNDAAIDLDQACFV
mmetsp:Transcript_204/g.531  ORF Transcript_204/g.531 Transcript_204/m.531 type:complete len:173 (-) Transcript_204:259-777(-)